MKDFVQQKLKEAFPEAEIHLTGDDQHLVLFIKDKVFKGLSRVQQHQLVYKTLGPIVGHELHALSLKVSGEL